MCDCEIIIKALSTLMIDDSLDIYGVSMKEPVSEKVDNVAALHLLSLAHSTTAPAEFPRCALC